MYFVRNSEAAIFLTKYLTTHEQKDSLIIKKEEQCIKALKINED